MTAGGTGSANTPMVAVIDHDVPTDPVALAAKRREQAEERLASAERAVITISAALAIAEAEHTKAQESAALAVAEEEVAAARAALKGLD